jgi:hypothetical protein
MAGLCKYIKRNPHLRHKKRADIVDAYANLDVVARLFQRRSSPIKSGRSAYSNRCIETVFTAQVYGVAGERTIFCDVDDST